MQRPERVSGNDVSLGHAGCGARALGIHLNEGVQLRLGFFDAIERGRHRLDWRYFPRGDEPRQVNGGHLIQLRNCHRRRTRRGSNRPFTMKPTAVTEKHVAKAVLKAALPAGTGIPYVERPSTEQNSSSELTCQERQYSRNSAQQFTTRCRR